MYWGFTGNTAGIRNRISTFLETSRKALYLILDVIGTLCLGIGAAWQTSKGTEYYAAYWDPTWAEFVIFFKSPIFLILLGIIFYCIAKYFNWKDNNNLFTNNEVLKASEASLQSQMRLVTEDKEIIRNKLELAYRELVITWLSTSMQTLGILTPNIRATVYYFKNGAFHYVGRHSKNPMIAKVTTNKVILNGGVLSKAWTKGDYEDLEECPIYIEDENKYFLYQSQKYGFSEEKVKQLTMKPCQYYAKTITDSFEPIGIIIFECDIRFLNSARVRKIGQHCTSHESNLISYIKKVREQDIRASQPPIEDIEADFLKGLNRKDEI